MSRITCFKFFKLLLSVTLVISFYDNVSAQAPTTLQTVSPYSRFGIGDLVLNGSLFNTGMGGGGIGYRNDSLVPQYLNFQNPASFSSNNVVAYEVGVSSNTVMLQSASAKGGFNQTRLSGIAIGFPVTKWWGAGFGLVPYSSMGYDVTTNDSVTGVGAVTYKYEGSGGVNQFFFDNGLRPFFGAPRKFLLSETYANKKLEGDTTWIKKKLACKNALANISIGVNGSYMFGTLYNIRRDEFPDSTYTFDGKISKRTLFHDFYTSFGIQYTFRYPRTLNPLYIGLNDTMVTKTKLFGNEFYYRNKTEIDTADLFLHKPGAHVTFGAVFAPATDLNVSYDLLAQTYKLLGTYELFRDTILFNENVKSSVTMPMMGGFGFSIKKDYKWVFQADWMMQMWSDAVIMGVNPGLQNSQRITAGFQLQPKQAGRGNYFGITQYRLGAHYYKTNLAIHDVQLSEVGVNFSMSLPAPYLMRLGEPISRATISFEYGMRGTTDHNLIKENYFRVSIGMNINDKWFNRVKYE
jgi:hypothetical protein